MVRYYKRVENGYLIAIGTGPGGTQITADEYIQLQETIAARPLPPEGYDYRLTEDLIWEEYDAQLIPAGEHDPEQNPAGWETPGGEGG